MVCACAAESVSSSLCYLVTNYNHAAQVCLGIVISQKRRGGITLRVWSD